MRTTTLTKKTFLQRMGEDYDKAAEKGAVDQFVAHMFEVSSRFNQPVLTVVDMAVIGETDGSETLAQAKDVFTHHVAREFKYYGTDVPSKATTALPVTVSDLQKNVAMGKIFVPPPGRTIDDLCIPQSQIKKFCKDYREKLRQPSYSTLFLFKVDKPEGGEPEYFVVRVSVYSRGRGLRALVRRFDHLDDWRAGLRHRVVLPQLQ